MMQSLFNRLLHHMLSMYMCTSCNCVDGAAGFGLTSRNRIHYVDLLSTLMSLPEREE